MAEISLSTIVHEAAREGASRIEATIRNRPVYATLSLATLGLPQTAKATIKVARDLIMDDDNDGLASEISMPLIVCGLMTMAAQTAAIGYTAWHAAQFYFS